MSTSSAPIILCGHCGRPVADNPTKNISGATFHVECTMSPYAVQTPPRMARTQTDGAADPKVFT